MAAAVWDLRVKALLMAAAVWDLGVKALLVTGKRIIIFDSKIEKSSNLYTQVCIFIRETNVES